MNREHDHDPTMDRRTFVRAAAVAAFGATLFQGTRGGLAREGGDEPEAESLPLGIPGPYPGRVIEVHHPGSVVQRKVQLQPVRDMVRRGMAELTGAPGDVDAWRRFFEPEDVVGIKVNPVGAPRAISSHELVHEVVAGVRSAGVKAKDIIVFDRYRRQFRRAGYVRNLPEGVRWDASVEDYDPVQLDIDGYDPEVYREMDLVSVSDHDPRDDRSRRSHLSLIVSRKVNKIINLPVLKDHGSAGVTLALKNMSHGFVNNVARSHATPTTNACNTFIPAIVSIPQIRSRVVLHILDGTRAVWEGGPSARAATTWDERTMYFATDPVALDRIAWEVVDRKRVAMGLPVVAQSHFRQPRDEEARRFHSYRQPQHIELASALGLGVFDRGEISHSRVELG